MGVSEVTLAQIITVIAVLGSAMTVYYQLRKFGERMAEEATWRTGVNADMKALLTKIGELLDSQKSTAQVVQSLIEFRIDQNHSNLSTQKELAAAWKKIDAQEDKIIDLWNDNKDLRIEMNKLKSLEKLSGKC